MYYLSLLSSSQFCLKLSLHGANFACLMHRENKALSNSLEAINAKYAAFADEKRDLQSQIEKQRGHIKQLTQARDSSAEQLSRLQKESTTMQEQMHNLVSTLEAL